METNITKIVNEIERILTTDGLKNGWGCTMGEQYGSFGALGAMSPLNRAAFVHTYGEQMTALYEKMAREQIEQKRKWFEQTYFSHYVRMADAHQGVPQFGDFVWCSNSGMKKDGGDGAYGEINDLLLYNEDKRLCNVMQVIEVTSKDFSRRELADELVRNQPQDFEKYGSQSDDVDVADYDEYNPTKEQLATFFTLGTVVVNTDNGKWFLINSESYNYARYIYMPTNWREMFATEVEIILEREKARKMEEERIAAEEKAERYKEYQECCKKWQHLMTDVNPLVEEERRLWGIYQKTYNRKSPEYKAYKTACLKTNNARKANILAMCRSAFPGVKFSLKKNDGWGASYTLSWVDEMTEKEFREKTDLILFEHGHEYFDGMTDSTGYTHQEFSDFADFTMGKNATRGDVELSREVSEKAYKKADEVLAELGITKENCEDTMYRLHDRPEFEHFNYNRHTEFRSIRYWVAHNVSFYVEQTPKNEPQEPINGDFQIIPYSERAIVVLGDTKAIKDELKKLGGRFNPKLSCGAGWVFPRTKEDELKKLLAV